VRWIIALMGREKSAEEIFFALFAVKLPGEV
jgi:hypothetical protein